MSSIENKARPIFPKIKNSLEKIDIQNDIDIIIW